MSSVAGMRCGGCGGKLWRYGGTTYCPECTRFETCSEWLFATVAGAGTYVECGRDLDGLLGMLRLIMCGGSDEDVVISRGRRVVAVVKGDDLAVVRVRE